MGESRNWREILGSLISTLRSWGSFLADHRADQLQEVFALALAEIKGAEERAESCQKANISLLDDYTALLNRFKAQQDWHHCQSSALRRDYEALLHKATTQDKTIDVQNGTIHDLKAERRAQDAWLQCLRKDKEGMSKHISLLDWIVYMLYTRIDDATNAPLTDVVAILDGCNDVRRESVSVEEVTKTVGAVIRDEYEPVDESDDAIREFNMLMKEFINLSVDIETKRATCLGSPIFKLDPAKVSADLDPIIQTILGIDFGNAGIL